MKNDEIVALRRTHLSKWFSDKTIPRNEKSYISQLMSGKASFAERAARRLEAEFNMPDGYLTAPHLFIESAETNKTQQIHIDNQPKPNTDHLDIPVLDIRASMGTGIDAPDYEPVISHLHLSEKWLRANLTSITGLDNIQIITGYGDSMEPTYSHGDTLFVDVGVRELNLDAIYVLRLNGELYIKRVQRRPDAVWIISDNKENYPPYPIDRAKIEDFQVIGRVCGLMNFNRV